MLLLRDEAGARATFNAEDADYIKVHGYTEDEAFAFWITVWSCRVVFAR